MSSAITFPKPKLWTPEALADYLGVPVSWVYKRTRKKNAPEHIPHIKLGKYIRFDPESKAFQAWLSCHEAGSQSSMAAETLTADSPLHKVQSTEKTGQIN